MENQKGSDGHRDILRIDSHNYTTVRFVTKRGWVDIRIKENGSLEALAEHTLAVVGRAANSLLLYITRKG